MLHDYQEQYIKEAVAELSREMDLHVLADVYLKSGWTEVVVDPWKHSDTVEIESWCDQNIKIWIRTGNRFIIKQKQDATIFALKWV